jgi:hypothetical protein
MKNAGTTGYIFRVIVRALEALQIASNGYKVSGHAEHCVMLSYCK